MDSMSQDAILWTDLEEAINEVLEDMEPGLGTDEKRLLKKSMILVRHRAKNRRLDRAEYVRRAA